MATQRETLLIAEPMDICFESHGWYMINTHGNQFQAGLPDRYCCHAKYSPRWIEYKVFESNQIHLTRAQKIRFPIMYGYNVPIFVIAGTDLRGKDNYVRRERLYNKIFQEPNVAFVFNKRMHRLLK